MRARRIVGPKGAPGIVYGQFTGRARPACEPTPPSRVRPVTVPKPSPGRVLILGLPYFGRMLQEQLGARGWHADYHDHPGRNPAGWAEVAGLLLRADLLYLVGSRADRWSAQDLLLRGWRRPVVIHWVGTDVLLASEARDRGQLSAAVAQRPRHLCDAPWLIEELATLGMTAEYLPLPVPGLSHDAPPLPAAFRVLMYLPVDAFDREVFDMETLLALPRLFPEVQFTLLPSPPDTLPGELPPNLRALGWHPNLDPIYRESTVLIRLTSHDGTSFSALEAMSRGRYVIWSFPMPGAILARGRDEVAEALRVLIARHAAGVLGFNEEGMRHAREEFDPPAAVDALDLRLRAILGERGRPRHTTHRNRKSKIEHRK